MSVSCLDIVTFWLTNKQRSVTKCYSWFDLTLCLTTENFTGWNLNLFSAQFMFWTIYKYVNKSIFSIIQHSFEIGIVLDILKINFQISTDNLLILSISIRKFRKNWKEMLFNGMQEKTVHWVDYIITTEKRILHMTIDSVIKEQTLMRMTYNQSNFHTFYYYQFNFYISSYKNQIIEFIICFGSTAFLNTFN